MGDTDEDREALPLLFSPPTPTSPTGGYNTTKPDSSSAQGLDASEARAIENDVLPETSTLGRTLNRQSAYILVISRVLGSGIFATPGTIIRAVGSVGLALSLWVVGAVVAACGLAIALEYGSMLPRSGGEKVYLEFTYRRPRFLASTVIAIMVVCLGFTASNCVVFSQYVLFAAGVEEPAEWVRKGVAVGLLTAITITHGVFRAQGVRIQNFLGWIKVGLIVFMILSGLYVVIFRPTGSAPGASTLYPVSGWNDLWQGSNWNWGVISTSLFQVFYSYAGLENANNVLNEVKDPVRTLRFVSVSALVTACVLYLLTNVAYFMVVPVEEIKASGELVAALFFERVFGGNVGGKLLPLAVALSAAGNVMVVAFAMSRVKQEIARQGFLPFSGVLSSTKPFGSPLGGLIVHYIPSLLVITLPPSKEVYSFILKVEGYPGQIIAIATAAGLLWLRYERPDLNRPFKAWVPAVALRIALSLALLAAPFFPPAKKPESGLFYATYAIVGTSILLFAVIYWYLWTILVPKWRGYMLEERAEVLEDGTSITKLIHVPVSLGETRGAAEESRSGM